MCMGGYQPPYGIPIPPEIHDQYSPELKQAWAVFDAWWKEFLEKTDGETVSRSMMPDKVREAKNLICETAIPGYDGAYTGRDSCYMIGVDSMMTD